MSVQNGTESTDQKRPRKRRERAETDRLVYEAVRAMLVRDGVFAGFTLQNLADEAGVNRVQLYQNFGSKQGVLRAAILDTLDQSRPTRDAVRNLPFVERRLHVFEHFLANPDVIQLEALLAQDGDEELVIFPDLEVSRRDYERDIERGHLPADADPLAMHFLTAATYMGYCIFRDTMVRDSGLDPKELDTRILKAFSRMLEALASAAPED